MSVHPHLEIGRARLESARGHVNFWLSDVRIVKQDLTVEIIPFDDVVVTKAKNRNSRTRQADRGRTPETADPHDECARAGCGHETLSGK
jgi:hypothetical protein